MNHEGAPSEDVLKIEAGVLNDVSVNDVRSIRHSHKLGCQLFLPAGYVGELGS